MKTALNDVESHNVTLTEAISMTLNRLLWRLLAGYAEARNDDDDDDDDTVS